MFLTEQQIAFFDTFGFIKLPGLIKDDIGWITRTFDEIWSRHGSDHDRGPHDGTRRSLIFQFLDEDARFCSLLDDPRFDGIATDLLGDDWNYLSSDGNFYVGETPWHSDGWRPNDFISIKFAIYPDVMTRETGALRVIPGSHRRGDTFAEALQAQVRQSQELWGMAGPDVPAVALESVPGDVIIFNHNTKHASFGGNSARRMMCWNLSRRYREDELPELRERLGRYARHWPEGDRVYGPQMVRTAGPRRQRHLEQVMANDGHLAELIRQIKQEKLTASRG